MAMAPVGPELTDARCTPPIDWGEKELPYLLPRVQGVTCRTALSIAETRHPAYDAEGATERVVEQGEDAGVAAEAAEAAHSADALGYSPAAVVVSPGLCRLMNAALVDPVFCAGFLASPERAAELAADAPELTFGCTLPDASLRFTPLRLTHDDWTLIRRLTPAQTIAERWGQVHHLAASGARLPVHRSADHG